MHVPPTQWHYFVFSFNDFGLILPSSALCVLYYDFIKFQIFFSDDFWKATYYIYLCLSHCSTPAKRLYDYSNSYKGKRLIGAGLQFQRFHALSSWWEVWQRAGRCVAGEVAKSSTSWSAGSRKSKRHWSYLGIWNFKAYPQWHTSSNKVIPPNITTPQ